MLPTLAEPLGFYFGALGVQVGRGAEEYGRVAAGRMFLGTVAVAAEQLALAIAGKEPGRRGEVELGYLFGDGSPLS